jgi:NADH:ubiquinone reductase (H+-translocating)
MVDADRLRSRILDLFEDADRDAGLIDQGGLNFVIVGGGATGTEIAGGLADMIHSTVTVEFADLAVSSARIYLIERGPKLLAPFSAKAHDYPSQILHRRGLVLKLNAALSEAHPALVALSDGSTIKTRCVVWGAGLKTAAIANGSGLPQGQGGRINVQHELTIEGFPGVYALRDFANIAGSDGDLLPQLASVAQQSGRWAGRNILADIEGQPRTAFHYRDKGIMAMIV